MAKDCNTKQKISRTCTPLRNNQKEAALQNPHDCDLNCDESNDSSSFSLTHSTEVTINELTPCRIWDKRAFLQINCWSVASQKDR